MVASIVPSAPDSPTLNAIVAVDPEAAPTHLEEMRARYKEAGVRRWGVWLDDHASLVAQQLSQAGMVITTACPGMGAVIEELQAPAETPNAADLTTVARVNDLAYGNYDGRLERTLAPLPNGILKGYKVDHNGSPAAVALALHHGDDCGVSFVATVPKARRRGLASAVMRQALTAAAPERLHDDDPASHRCRGEALRESGVSASVRDATVGAAAVADYPRRGGSCHQQAYWSDDGRGRDCRGLTLSA